MVLSKGTLEIQNLSFRFSENHPWVFREFNLNVPGGERVLLVGANGVGKSTLLRILGGFHLPSDGTVKWKGKSIFHELSLMNELVWVPNEFELKLDVRVSEFVSAEERRLPLFELLGLNPDWRMHAVSDGQRKRVQLFLALKNFQGGLVLLDEVMAHLDVTVRNDLLAELRGFSEKRGATVFYCTHIFDGLKEWPTSVLWLGTGGQHQYISREKLAKSVDWNKWVDQAIRQNACPAF